MVMMKVNNELKILAKAFVDTDIPYSQLPNSRF
jgi:hypothetical protein